MTKKIRGYLATFLTVLMLVNMLPLDVLADISSDWTREVDVETVTVTFDPTTDPNEQLQVHEIEVVKGTEIGDQLPDVPEVPGYTTKWVKEGTDEEVTAETVVEEEFTAVVAKDKIEYTVTFVQEDGTAETRSTSIDEGFAINSLPEVAPKSNQIGKWVYPGTTNEFTVGTVISEDLTVNAYYEQNIYTVEFMVDGAKVDEFVTAAGTSIQLPSDPIKAGATFMGWFTEPDGEGTQYTAESVVNSDITLYAYFSNQVRVSFIVKDKEGNIISEKSQYFVDLTVGDKITTLPDDPFVEGEIFEYWEHETEGDIVDVGYTVTGSFRAVAVFRKIDTYKLTVRYFYKKDDGTKVDVGTQIYDLVEADFPYTVTAPGYTVATEVSGEPTYYPSLPTITVEIGQFTEEGDKYVLEVEDEYVPADAEYVVGHYLKNLSGNGYGLIATKNKVGVKDSEVTPDINSYSYADFESRDEDVTITGTTDPKQELKVYYTRKNFMLSYNVGEGDYIDAVTAPYGTTVSLASNATRAGYTFDGWYASADYSGSRITSYTLDKDTVIFAKWKAAQSEYKIVYMIENANDDGYSYLATVTKQAATGSTVTMTASTAGASGTRPRDLDTTNFTFKDSTTGTVMADGTTVITVRYSRNVYTITWNGEGYPTSNSRWTKNQGKATLTAKYGADISAEWTAKFNTPHPNWAWNFSKTDNNQKFTSLDIMPSGNKTVYNWYYSTTKTQILNYWFENYDSTEIVTYNNHTYGLFKSVTVHYNYLYDTDYPDYPGYTKGGWVRSDGARNLTDSTPSGSMTADFYYNAQQYPLTFYNYDGTLISTQQVTLNADISSYLTDNIPTPPMNGATWKGWFTDPDHGEGTEYAGGTKMPAGLVLYGDFEFPTRTISYDSQGGTLVPSETGEYGFYAAKPDDPTKEHYAFKGWFTAAGDTGSPYDWNRPVTEDITLYAEWTQDIISYTVHYYEHGTTRKVMDDKFVSDPAFTEGLEITENAPTVAGHVADKAYVTIELSFDENANTIVFYYYPIPNEITYTVDYVLRDHPEIKIHESKTVTVSGTTTNVMEKAVEVDTAYLESQTTDPDILGVNYKPIESVKEQQLGLDDNVITFEYIPYTSSRITVNYLDMDGNEISAQDVQFVEKGDTFTLQNKAPEGYIYHHAYLDGTDTAPEPTYQITGNEGNMVINIYYQKKLIILANNKAKPYDGSALFSSFDNTADYVVSGLVRGDTLTSIGFDGSQTDAGTSATTPKNAQISKGDEAVSAPETYYNIIYVPGSLTVKPVSVYISVSADQWNTHSGGTGGPNYYTGQVFKVGFTNPGKQHFNEDPGKSAYISVTSGQRALFVEKYGDAIWDALYGADGALISEKDAGTYTYTGAEQRAIIAGVTVAGQSMMSDPNYSVTLYARDCFLKIEPLPLYITTPSAEKEYDGTALTRSEGATLDHSYWTENAGGVWTVAAQAAPGEVTLGTGDTVIFNVTGSQTPVGSSENRYSIEWGDVKSSNYKITAVRGTLTVTGSALTVTVNDKTAVYNGAEQEGYPFTASVTGTGDTITTDEYTVSGLGKGDVLTITYTPAKGTDTGSYTGVFAEEYTILNAEGENANENYASAVFDPGKLTIEKKSVKVTVTGNTDSKAYNGAEQKVEGYEVSISDALYTVTDFTFSGDAVAKGTEVGSYPMGLTESRFTNNNDNFDVTFEVIDGSLEITRKNVTVTIIGNSDTKAYNGSEQKAEGYEVIISDALYTEADFTFSGEAAAKGTAVGMYPMGLTVSRFTNENSNFNVTFNVTDGSLEITKKTVMVTIVGNSDTRSYSGAEQTVEGYDVTISDELYTEADFTFSGEAVAKGTAVGEYQMGLDESQFANNNDNFDVTFDVTDGTLIITKQNVTVTIVGAINASAYDGTEHTINGYSATASSELYDVENDFTFIGTAEAKRTDVGTTYMGLTADQFKNTNTNFDIVTFDVTDGYQKIDPIDITVTITGNNDTSPYDRKEHTVSGYTAKASSSLYDVNADITFSGTAEAKRTDAGMTYMKLEADQFENKNPNFGAVTFDVVDGYQKIDPIDITVTITGNYDTSPYDGKEHTVSGYTAEASSDLYDVDADFTFSGTAEAKRTDAGTTYMKLEAEQFENKNNNFGTVTFDVIDGYQKIDPIDITVTITGNNDTSPYDGKEHTVSGYTAVASSVLYDVKNDFTFSGTAEAKRTDAGTTYMELEAEQFENKNLNFGTVTFDVIDGYQKIDPIDITVTITGKNDTKPYDGTEHTVSGYTAEASSTLYDVNADFTFSGTAEAKRTDAGTTYMGLEAEQFKNNNTNFGTVTFKVTDGYQKIDPIDITVTVTGNTDTKPYDGTEHTVSGYTAQASSDLYDVANDLAFDGTAQAKRTDVGTTYMELTADQFSNTNTNFANVTFEVIDGWQTIDPIDVTVTIIGENSTNAYDGKEHSISGYTATADSELYDVTKDFMFNGEAEAKRTEAGTTYMELTASQFTNTNTNFGTVTFDVIDGYQKIDPIDITVTIIGANNTTDYDGNEHKVTGYDVVISDPLYTEADFTFNGTAEAAQTDAGTKYMGLKPEQFENINRNFGTVTFNVIDGYQTVNPINITVTIVGSNASTDYDGTEHSVSGYTVTADSTLFDAENDLEFSGTAAASRKDVGIDYMGLNPDQFSNTNPNFEQVTFDVTDGYQAIIPIDITVIIVGNNNETAYDGNEHSVSGYEVTIGSSLYTEADFTFIGKAEAKRTNAGTTYMGLKPEQFTNTNENFGLVTFEITDGYQAIYPAGVTVTIIGNSDISFYDGVEHSVSGYTASTLNPLYDVENDFVFKGTAAAVRTDAGTTNMGLKADQFENINSNFGQVTFQITDGYQTINPIDVAVTITGHNNTASYDRNKHSVSGYDVEISNSLYTEADFEFSGTADAARTDIGTSYMGLTPEKFKNTNDNFSMVVFTVTDGYQTVNPVSVTVTIKGHHNETAYDGNKHTVKGYDVVSDNPQLYTEADFEFTGTAEASRIDAGTTNMGLIAEQFNNINPNFTNVTFNVTDGYQAVNPINVMVTVTGKSDVSAYDGIEHTISGYTAEASSELYDVAKDFKFSGTAEASRTNAGTTPMGLSEDQFTNKNGNFGVVTFNVIDGYQTITPIHMSVTIIGHHNTANYDSAEHVVTGYDVEISNPSLYTEEDFKFSGTAEAKRTEVGTTEMGLKAGQFENTNGNFGQVTFNVTDGYQTITPVGNVVVTITGSHNTTDYDGAEHSVSGYTVEISDPLYTEADFEFSGTAEASRTKAGTTNMGLSSDQFTNTNTNFDSVIFNVTDGYQTVNPIDVTVTIVGDHDASDYDGNEHSVEGYTAEASSGLYDVTKDFTFSGTAEASRTNAGTTSMGLSEDQFTNGNENFATVTFNITDGYQTINPINVTVTIVGDHDVSDYDGKKHSVEGYTAEASSDLYDVDNDFTFSGTDEASRTDAGTTFMELSPDQFTNENGNFGTVTFDITDGYQTINPINVTVTITGANDTSDYDGAEHSVTGYEADASSDLYDVVNDMKFTGSASASRTNAGTTTMGLKTSQFRNTNNNFKTVTFNVTDGYQKINPIDITVTVTGANSTVDYDGEAHSVSGYTAKASTGLYDVENDITFSGTAEAVRTNAGTTYMGLAAEQFANTNGNFRTVTFNVTDGYQKIDPIDVIVTIIGASSTVDYDGEKHSVSGYTAKASSNLYDTKEDFTFSGTTYAERKDVGTTYMGLDSEQFENENPNFGSVTFNVTDGYQTIEKLKVTVTIVGNNETSVYDGEEHTATGYTAKASSDLYDVTKDLTFTGEAAVEGTNVGTYIMGLAEKQFANGNDNFSVTFNVTDGWVKITDNNVAPALVVTKNDNKPDDYEYSEGETVIFTITIKNIYNEPKTITLSEIDGITLAEASFDDVPAGETRSTEAVYVIKPADMAAGSFTNTVTVVLEGKNYQASDTVMTEPIEPGIKVTKTADKTTDVKVGETVTYTITAENTGNATLRNLRVTEGLTGVSLGALDKTVITPGDTATATATYVVKQGDIDAGEINNTATVKGTAPNNIRIGDAGSVKVTAEPASAKLKIEKTASPDSNLKVGNTVAYTVKVTNTGNVSVNTGKLTDDHADLSDKTFALAPGEEASFEYAYTVTQDDIDEGTVVNTVKANATAVRGDDPEEAKAEVTVTAEEAAAELSVSKSAEPDEGINEAGTVITYTIVVKNTGNVTVKNGTLADDRVDLSEETFELRPGNEAQFTYTYTVTQDDMDAGSIVNVVKANATAVRGDDPAETEATETVTVEQDSHLTVEKTATSTPENDGKYALGETISYSITVTNDGNVTITDITVTDEVTGDEWTIDSLAPGDSEEFKAEHTVTEEDILNGRAVNVATAEGTSPDPEAPEVPVEPGTDTEPVAEPDPSLKVVKKTTSTPANGETYSLGETITYSITVINDGNLTISDITVEDEAAGAVWTIGDLAPGASEEFTAERAVTEEDILAGKAVNAATADGSNKSKVPTGQGRDEVEDETEAKHGHLTLTKETASETPEGGYASGDTITYRITAINDGNLTLTNVVVSDELTGDEWIIESLEPGSSEEFMAEYTVTEKDVLTGEVVNVVTAAAESPDPDEPVITAVSTAVVEPAEDIDTSLEVTKSSDKAGRKVACGEIITYTITVKNNGNVTFTNIKVTDEMTGDAWTIDELPVGGTETFTATYTVTEEDILAGAVINSVSAAGDPIDDPKAPGNRKTPEGSDEAEDETEDLNTGLEVKKTSDKDGETVSPGEIITYTITVTNTGKVTARNVVVSDEKTGDKWTVDALTPGETETFTAAYTVTEADILRGEVLNSVTAAGDPVTDPKDPGNPKKPEGSDENRIPTEKPDPEFTIAKSVDNLPDRGYFEAGETATFNIVVTNTGNLTLRDIEIIEELNGAVFTAGDGYTVTADGRAAIAELPAGAAVTVKAQYTIKSEDAGEELRNVVSATGKGLEDPDDPSKSYDPDAQTGEAPIPVESEFTLTIYYLFREGGTAAKTFIKSGMKKGETYSVMSPNVEGYTPDIERATGTIEGNTTLYVYYDIDSYTLTIYYRYVDGGTAAPTVVQTYEYDEAYDVKSPVIEGYTCSRPRCEGRMPARDVTYTVYYYKIGDPADESGESPAVIGAVTLNAGDTIE